MEQLDRHDFWHVEWTLTKRRVGEETPYSVLRFRENLLLNAGITLFMKILTGQPGSFNKFDAANAYLKVGSSAAAAAAGQTDLQGGSTAEAPMDAGFPQVAAQTMSFQSTFGTAAANFAWNEGAIKNGAGAVSASVVLLNRRVQAMGTKPNTEVWTLLAQITIA